MERQSITQLWNIQDFRTKTDALKGAVPHQRTCGDR